MEEWKIIKGYDGKYQVSNYGRVKSLWRNRPIGRGTGLKKIYEEKILNLQNNNGYKFVTLMDNGKRNRCYVHRLVAETFLPNPNNKPVVNHIDYNPSNNNVENLEWCTQKENIIHSVVNFPKRKLRRTNTGERYIHKTVCNTYLVRIGKQKTFKTITDAIVYRNDVLKKELF